MARSFRSAGQQAAHAVRSASAIGQPRHGAASEGTIHSYGTARSYEQALKGFAEWRGEHGCSGTLMQATTAEAARYLTERTETVCQKTVDLDRQAMAVLPRVETLERVRSLVESRTGLGTESRAYTSKQIDLIAAAQRPEYALATQIAAAAGLRAHELLTLRPAAEQPADTHRAYRDDRFDQREGAAFYTVTGKGGLTREVALSRDLASRLEAQRLDTPRSVIDRGIRYEQAYRIAGGNAWSADFTRHSKGELGWSAGAHGLRHSYAQDRMTELTKAGHSFSDAREIVSQELGHFREDITSVYLR